MSFCDNENTVFVAQIKRRDLIGHIAYSLRALPEHVGGFLSELTAYISSYKFSKRFSKCSVSPSGVCCWCCFWINNVRAALFYQSSACHQAVC